MRRAITGFDTDDKGDRRAVLSCGHFQHVRHNPPFTNRPWVTTKEGRMGKIGVMLNCARCDRFELPDGFVRYFRTSVFTEHSIPEKIRKDHTTKSGIWAKIVIEEGGLKYFVASMGEEFELSKDHPGVVLPEVPHYVEPLGKVKFFLEFYRSPASGK